MSERELTPDEREALMAVRLGDDIAILDNDKLREAVWELIADNLVYLNITNNGMKALGEEIYDR